MKCIKNIIPICIAAFITLTGCADYAAVPVAEKSDFAMDTIAVVKIYGECDAKTAETAITAAFERLHELDSMLDYNSPDSELSRINAAAYGQAVEISVTMAELIEKGLELSRLTDGAFDISLGSLIDLWNGEKPPNQQEITELLPHLGYENINLSQKSGFENVKSVKFANEYVKIHFGAIAKGYAVDEMTRILREHGVSSAIIEFGGEIGVIGESPREGGLWKIGIRDPFGGNEPIETLLVRGGINIATSGTYERGEHIFDRFTGRPAFSEFASVTVLNENGAVSDALSTAVFTSGLLISEESKLWEEVRYCVIGITKEGEVTNYHRGGCNLCNGGNRGSGAISH